MPKSHIAMAPVESSQIHAIGHDADTATLAVRFKNYKGEPSSLYHYANFSADQFETLKSADSLGSHFIANVKRNEAAHPFTKIDETEASANV